MILGRGGGGGPEDSEGLGRIMAALPLRGGEMSGVAGGMGLPPPPRKGEEGSSKAMAAGIGSPQWGQQETRDLIAIRAVLERDSSLAKRNKTLWEAVAARMRERGYRRTPEQCKCKWKNLVNRYKGKETSGQDAGRHCPFFDELHAVFAERAQSMRRQLLESESSGAPAGKRKQKRGGGDNRSSDDFSDGGDDEEDSDEDAASRSKKKRPGRAAPAPKAVGSVLELLQGFIQQQLRMEAQWQEMVERRAEERRAFQQEWRESMEKLERERIMMEQSWREREELRRMKEEARAEKREALLTTLLNKLIHEDL
ncbi:trihelix transcription factor GT-3b-like [Wolffia australiana]